MVTQMFTPGVPAPAAGLPEESDGDLATLARMEIGGNRFLLPLADIVAVIEPTAMEPQGSDPHGIWIGHVHSHRSMIAVASGSALIRARDQSIEPGRIAILRGDYPVGLAVDRMLSAEAVNRHTLIPLPPAVPCIQSSPAVAGYWNTDDELELLLERDVLVTALDAEFAGPPEESHATRQARRKMLERYRDVEYSRGLEVRFDASQERWIIPMSTVRLVTDSRMSHPLPGAPDKVTGLVSWQRQPIPVIDPSVVVELDRPVSLPAKFVVVGEPVGVGETSVQADAAITVDRVIGIHHNLHIEHGLAWDDSGDAMNILRIPDILA